jgi:hypothetical protein
MVIFYSVTIVKYVNDRENRRGNQEWKIQRHLQHWVVKNARETEGAIIFPRYSEYIFNIC